MRQRNLRGEQIKGLRFSANYVIVIKTRERRRPMKKEKRPLTDEEKQAKKENAQGWLFMIFFLVAFIAMFAFYGMQSTLFGGG